MMYGVALIGCHKNDGAALGLSGHSFPFAPFIPRPTTPRPLFIDPLKSETRGRGGGYESSSP